MSRDDSYDEFGGELRFNQMMARCTAVCDETHRCLICDPSLRDPQPDEQDEEEESLTLAEQIADAQAHRKAGFDGPLCVSDEDENDD